MNENIYDDCNNSYINAQRTANSVSEAKGTGTNPTKMTVLKAVLRVFCIVALCALLGTTVHIILELKGITTQLSTKPAQQQTGLWPSRILSSCKELKASGITESGYYLIRPQKSSETVVVYCDMKTDGGGWTLVASVNENNLDNTCSKQDVWFHSIESHGSVQLESSNWENKLVFGSAHTAVATDYKSSAYFSMEGEDIMIRHAPSVHPTDTSETTAFLQYQTNNHFLKMYGGNLYNFFKNHYPLLPKLVVTFDHKKVLDNLEKRASEVAELIPNFYQYVYPSGTNFRQLNSAGNNMFASYGMQVQYSGAECNSYVYYNKIVRCPTFNTVFSSRTSYPFFAMFFIGNLQRTTSSQQIQVRSYRPNTDNQTSYTATILDGSYTMIYNAQCRDSMQAAVPNYCDVFYLVKNEKVWGTLKETEMRITSTRRSTYYYLYARPSNVWSKVILGYSLLASTNEGFIPQANIAQAMKKILRIVAETNIGPIDCSKNNGPAIAITISKGSNYLNSTLPPLVSGVTPGYLQLRTYGLKGTAFALCPGIKVDSCDAEFVCIGGVRNSTYAEDCNDFANWNGKSGDVVLPKHANRFAHSHQDIYSTIMISYR